MGGVGLYMSPHDYLKLLRHILQIYGKRWPLFAPNETICLICNIGGKAANPILNQDTVKAMFVGTLDEVASNSLCTLLGAPLKSHSWSNALATCEVDYPGGRKKGSAFCESSCDAMECVLTSTAQGQDGREHISLSIPQEELLQFMGRRSRVCKADPSTLLSSKGVMHSNKFSTLI